MPMSSTDMNLFLSGGASNTLPDASLGGARSSTAVGTAIGNLFDAVAGAESTAGDTEYRCAYVANLHASLTAQTVKVYIASNTPSASTAVRIALGTSAVNGVEQTIANESTAPTGVSWVTAPDEANAVALGNIPVGQHRAIWIERVVTAGAAYNDDQCTLRIKWDTAA